jgi:hypothetical protein
MRKDQAKIFGAMTFVILIACVLLSRDPVHSVLAFSSGPEAGHTGAPGELTCATAAGCHGGEANTGPGEFFIEAPASYQPGETLEITVRHSTPDTSRRRWGFQLTALSSSNEKAGTLESDGTLNILNGGPGNSRQYIEHGIESSFSGRQRNATWTFNWRAPNDNVGPVTLWAAGNQANNDGTSSGDQIYTTDFTINPPSAGPPSIEAAEVNKKKLIVTGVNFDIGATLLVNGKKAKKTSNDETNPSSMMTSKKAGKSIAPGDTVILEVRNLDGTMSPPFSFTRPQ